MRFNIITIQWDSELCIIQEISFIKIKFQIVVEIETVNCTSLQHHQ